MITAGLPRSLTIRTVKEVQQSIIDVITKNEPLILDAHGVEEVDTAGLQLLAAIVAFTALTPATVTLRSPSQQLQASATLAGLVIPEH